MEGKGGIGRERMQRRGRKGGDLLHKFRGIDAPYLIAVNNIFFRFGITQTILGSLRLLLYIWLQMSTASVVNVSLSKIMNIG